uniref:Uncharacterized protein n=1 Tax=Oryza glumipatula TaxID=40148 RepID=A0A0E0B953_9ORYZ
MASLNADPSPVTPSRPLLSSMTQQATARLDGDAQIPSPPIRSTDGPQFASSFPPKPSPAPWAEGLQEVCARQGSGRLVGVALKYSKVLSWPLTSKQSVLRLEVAEHWYRLYKTDNQGVPQSGSTSTPFWQPRKPHAPIYALRLCSLHLVPPSRPLDRHGLNYSNSSLQVFFLLILATILVLRLI